MVMTPGFHCRGHRVRFLVRQVRSSKVHGAARNKKKERQNQNGKISKNLKFRSSWKDK